MSTTCYQSMEKPTEVVTWMEAARGGPGTVDRIWGRRSRRRWLSSGGVAQLSGVMALGGQGDHDACLNSCGGSLERAGGSASRIGDLAGGGGETSISSSVGDGAQRSRPLTVHVPAACEVEYGDGSELWFATTVAGTLDKGRLTDVEGLKTEVLI